jgi:hypothetical protein
MKKLILVIVSLATLPGAVLRAQDISGNWQGTLHAGRGGSPFQSDRIFLYISKASSGDWKAILYSFDRYDGHPMLAAAMTFQDSALKFSAGKPQGSYAGTLNPEGTLITGAWTQDGNQRQLDFNRTFFAERVTREQLEQILTVDHGKRDGKVASELSGLEMTARLSTAALSRYETYLPGRQARQALLALADRSAFLDPPADEIPAMAKPDPAAQRKMLTLAIDYVSKTIRQLPNLFATRATTSFEDNLWTRTKLRPAGTYSAIVRYRDGDEQIGSALFASLAPGLTTSGEFGPILGTALLDAAHGNLTWSHWEQGAAGPEAVFRYAVTADKSHYVVDGEPCAYYGEIAIDPETGTVRRVVLRGDMEPPSTFLSANIMVEYGPVELGGKTYICPLRGVALSQELASGYVNDVIFEQYHLYHATARILPGRDDGP